MKKLLPGVVAVLVILSCGSGSGRRGEAVHTTDRDVVIVIVDTVASRVDRLPNRTVAVVGFTDIDGKESEEGKILAEQVITKLAGRPGVKVVERTRLAQVLDEQKLSLTGITEGDDLEVGRIVNADAVVSGTIADLGEYQEINSRMVGVKTGEIFAAANARRSGKLRDQALESLSDEDRARIENERRLEREWKAANPKLDRIRTEMRRELVALRAKNPAQFQKTVRTVRVEDHLKRNRPQILFLLTEPRDSKTLLSLKSANPREFEKARRFRADLLEAMELVPSFREKVTFDRAELIRKGFK